MTHNAYINIKGEILMMKIRRMLTVLGLGAVTLTALSSPAEAADSEASINFTPGSGTPDLIDPDNPSGEPFVDDPDNPIGNTTNEAGPLSLDFVPNINFGSGIEISATNETYDAVDNSDGTSPFVQVTDLRGTAAGWNLTAEVSSFVTSGTDDETLLGAEIVLSGGDLVTNAAHSSQMPQITSASVVLPADGSSTPLSIMNASPDTGMGSWALRWPDLETPEDGVNENIQLNVPGGSAAEGSHTASITWTLDDTPIAE